MRADDKCGPYASQEGGADVIELGVPFTDPQADGTTIQATNEVREAGSAQGAIAMPAQISEPSAFVSGLARRKSDADGSLLRLALHELCGRGLEVEAADYLGLLWHGGVK